MLVNALNPNDNTCVIHGRVYVITAFRAVRPRDCLNIITNRGVLSVLYRLLILRNLLMNSGIVAFLNINNSGN